MPQSPSLSAAAGPRSLAEFGRALFRRNEIIIPLDDAGTTAAAASETKRKD